MTYVEIGIPNPEAKSVSLNTYLLFVADEHVLEKYMYMY